MKTTKTSPIYLETSAISYGKCELSATFHVKGNSIVLKMEIPTGCDLVWVCGFTHKEAMKVLKSYVEIKIGANDAMFAGVYMECAWLREILLKNPFPVADKVLVSKSFLLKLTIAYSSLLIAEAKKESLEDSEDHEDLYQALHYIGILEKEILSYSYEEGSLKDKVLKLSYSHHDIGQVEV